MKYRIKKTNECQRILTGEVSEQKLEDCFCEVFKEFQKHASLRGYRQGKAPISHIESVFGKEVEAEVVQSLVKELTVTCLKETGIWLATKPVVKELKVERGKRMTFKSEMECFPQFQLKKSLGMKITKPRTSVDEGEIDRTLQSLADSRAEYSKLEASRPVIGGDVVRCDIERDDNGSWKPFKKGAWLLVDVKGNEKQISEGLMGASEGESREISLENSGKYRVYVQEVGTRKSPPLDDALAALYKKKTITELREDIRRDMERFRDWQAKENMKEQIFERLIKDNPIPLPPSAVQQEKARLLDEMKAQHESGSTEDNDKRVEERAEREIRLYLILERLTKDLKPETSAEEVEKEVLKLRNSPRSAQDADESSAEDIESRVIQRLKREKAVQVLLDKAVIEEAKEEKS